MAAAVPTYMPQGYHRLAGIMSRDKSIAIFRRFDDVSMLYLLSLQAEIVELKKQFSLQCELDDSSRVGNEKEFSQYFLSLHTSKGNQFRSLRKIGDKVQKYSKCWDNLS